MKALLHISLMFLLLIAGCATRPKWDERIGRYTYGEALLELGMPSHQTRLPNGNMLAEWRIRPPTPGSVGYGPAAEYHTAGILERGGSRRTPPQPGRVLVLYFSESEKLLNWRVEER